MTMKLWLWLRKLLDFFSHPSRRHCPYCHGGKCLSACQMIDKKE